MVKHQHKIQKATVGDHNYENLFDSPTKQQKPQLDNSLRTKFFYVRKLIKAKNYNQARYELLGINHPKAEQWLEKLNQRDPNYFEKNIVSAKGILFMIIVACVGVGIAIGLFIR